jgi:hypothetical protein
MKPASSKAKGRRGQQYIQKLVLAAFPELTKEDVVSCPMGDTGEDLILSEKARKLLPFQFEIKAKAKSQIHTYYDQAKEHGDHEPLVIVKLDRHVPLAVVRFEHFLELLQKGK